MGANQRSKEEVQAIRDSIAGFLDDNGNRIAREVREQLNPDCSDSMIDANLKRWRIANGIPVKGKILDTSIIKTTRPVEPVKVDPDPQVDTPSRKGEPIELPGPDKAKPVDDTHMHNFSCAGKVPVDVYQKFKVIAAYRNESARSLIGEWMADYVEKHKGVFREISALGD
jgi:hypothetical protein